MSVDTIRSLYLMFGILRCLVVLGATVGLVSSILAVRRLLTSGLELRHKNARNQGSKPPKPPPTRPGIDLNSGYEYNAIIIFEED